MRIFKAGSSLLFSLLFMFMATSCTQEPSNQVVVWPEVTKEMKPWTRWWWMGSAVNEKNLDVLISDYADKGFGGVEIAPIYGAMNYEEQYIEYLSPRWMEILSYVVDKSNSVGMGVDMTNGTGWPFGGPHISGNEAARRLFIQEYEVTANQTEMPVIKINDQRQVDLGATLIALKGYDQDDSIVNLIDYIDENQRLTWKPESGVWKVVAAFDGRSRQLVKRAAPGGEGYTFDHLHAPALEHYLSRFDEVFKGENPGVRCFFNDSYELFGASWATNMFDEFEKRRGYDLSDYILHLAGKGDQEITARIKSDYRETMSELLIENFSTRWTEWVNGYGAKTRNQSHGSPANLLDVYATVDIPEIETFGAEHFKINGFFWDEGFAKEADHNLLFLKMAASAANITGKKLVSCETFTWAGEHFRTPLSQLKPEAEQVFLSGVNHIFYHGTTYSPQEAEWPGWLFYASVNFAPSNSFWPHVKGLNEYITRCQSILQGGTAANDLLVYWPIYDTWHNAEGMDMMMSVHGSKTWLASEQLQAMLKLGYSFDFVSDNLLTTLNVVDGKLVTKDGQNSYQALVIPECKIMPLHTLELIKSLAKAGVPVVMQNVPEDVPGLSNLSQRRNEMGKILASFSDVVVDKDVRLKTSGNTSFVLSQNIEKAINYVGVKRESFTDLGLKYIRRYSKQGIYYYLVNHSPYDIDEVIDLNYTASNALMLDPQTGKAGAIPIDVVNGTSKVRLQAKSGEAFFILLTDLSLEDVATWNYYENAGSQIVIDGQWEIEFLNGGPSLPAKRTINNLMPWTEIGDEEINSFSGTAKYSINFNIDDLTSQRYQLDLGQVLHSANVTINGNNLGIIWSPPFTVDVTGFLNVGNNVLEVEITNLMANRIRHKDINGEVWQLFHEINFVNVHYRKFDASTWPVMPSGLSGPVKIIPQTNIKMPTPALAVKNGETKSLVFNFGINNAGDDAYSVPASMKYNNKNGFGFDFGSKPIDVNNEKGSNVFGGGVTSESPFFFSVNLPEGNYKVTVMAGSPHSNSELTVKAESRRLMVLNEAIEAGKNADFSFVVNVRTPYFGEKDSIRRKPREYGYLNWDDKLTLEFNGVSPSVYGLKIEPVNDVITVFLAGNSTVVDQEGEPYASWGQMITRYFNNEVVVANYAESGESMSSFKAARRFDKILSLMKTGDFLFVEFGHNDQKQSGDGIGPFDSFTNLQKEFVTKAREKGGIPVLVTPMHRRVFDNDDLVVDTHGDYPDAIRKVAQSENIPLIDLNNMSRTLYQAWGQEYSKQAFVHYPANTFPGQISALADNTHFNNYGAYMIGLSVVKGIRDSVPQLAKYLTNDAPAITLNKPIAASAVKIPHSIRAVSEKPDGN